jgi:hypothetical protein
VTAARKPGGEILQDPRPSALRLQRLLDRDSVDMEAVLRAYVQSLLTVEL